MILSILICTLPERAEKLKRLLAILRPQITADVEIITDDRGRHITTGQKRNELLHKAKGIYSVFIDDDDIVSHDYVLKVLQASIHNPDCITFRGHMTTNGFNRVNFVLRLGEKYEERNGIYYRFPNHIVPIKTQIGRQVAFENITHGEDYKWALQIKDRNLLKTEFYIDSELYHYDYFTKK
jgi:glycosyltransferase involved in cell wall biosynthesis